MFTPVVILETISAFIWLDFFLKKVISWEAKYLECKT